MARTRHKIQIQQSPIDSATIPTPSLPHPYVPDSATPPPTLPTPSSTPTRSLQDDCGPGRRPQRLRNLGSIRSASRLILRGHAVTTGCLAITFGLSPSAERARAGWSSMSTCGSDHG
ncbi:uncharacterized protein BO97DRAFT_402047 [Aspergillus homomorphus CBS 101889]|uniref:Uncharacterized protein n=1 Tax=Aspergillus homomorphus (strain CBS 101889) TaxID=1450537 RepID=A0A395ICF0_ASPHC|nr:hypothetical protein BO97DRAFT_402047 [Aspergillus homomorphus CBS 101889]RAL17479.1 hypothetical protein BO97DRAFT_402047 [Aspergillus homomorphus CBS 101889]